MRDTPPWLILLAQAIAVVIIIGLILLMAWMVQSGFLGPDPMVDP